mgnify:CR=1 FL=1
MQYEELKSQDDLLALDGSSENQNLEFFLRLHHPPEIPLSCCVDIFVYLLLNVFLKFVSANEFGRYVALS